MDAINGRAALQAADEFGREIGAAAKQGTRAYTYHDKLADDARSTLLDLVSAKGVKGFENARQMWAQWAPIRNQTFRDFKPYLQTGTELTQGMGRLTRVALGNDPGNARFISTLEDLLGESLLKDLRPLAAKMSASQKATAAAKIRQQLSRRAMQAQAQTARSRIGERKFQARTRQLEQGALAKV